MHLIERYFAKTINGNGSQDGPVHHFSTASIAPSFSGGNEFSGMWDAVVVGAGPAGSVAAALLAERSKRNGDGQGRILLLEKKKWPRDKACGGCINTAGVRMLEEMGLGAVLAGAVPLRAMTLHMNGHSMVIPTAQKGTGGGAAIARQELDRRLVEQATARGCTFLSETHARLLPEDRREAFRRIALTHNGQTREVQARVVLACDGQSGGFVGAEPWGAYEQDEIVRLGFATTVPDAVNLPAGTIGMFVGEHDYVGLVRLADGTVHVGASLGAEACHAARGPRDVIHQIFMKCGYDGVRMDPDARFGGTTPLSGRRRVVGGYRVLAVGDACGYVEPFTGEGISWAIRGARAAVEMLPRQLLDWPMESGRRWTALHEKEVVRRQRWCRRLRYVLRRPKLALTCMGAARLAPWAPALLAREINA